MSAAPAQPKPRRISSGVYVRAPEGLARTPEVNHEKGVVAALLDRRLDERGVSNVEVERRTGLDEKRVRRLRRGEEYLSVAAAVVMDRHFDLGLLASLALATGTNRRH